MENNITNKELFYNYAESLGIKINDAQRLMVLALASREEALPQADVIKLVCDHLHTSGSYFGGDKFIVKCKDCNEEL